jgi:hypothetical protein
MRRILTIASAAVLAVGASAACLAASASASTAKPAASGAEHFVLIATSVGPTSLTFHAIYYGVVTGAGTELSPNNSNADVVHLPGGTFKLVHTAPPSPSVNTKTCVAVAKGKATWHFADGTGKYKGISGHGSAVINEVGILGKVHGACSLNALPAAFFIVVNGSGSAS